jgi:UDP-N-acetylglucosamine--N-acetylmuramyl-(pentapeptide) pyrophosphoryl-undecaprenol N-acetylglucosamine transferase
MVYFACMKIVISCGGTGGHVFPGLATAEELVTRGNDVVILATGRDVESAAMQGWAGPIEHIGLAKYGKSCLPIKGFMLFSSFFRSLRAIRTLKPSALLAMGGYSSIGPVLAAKILGIPVILHEGNAVPGRAIRSLSRFATAIAVNYECSVNLFGNKTARSTGFPVRKSLVDAAKTQSGRGDIFKILVLGGSQGSQFLNKRMPEVMKELSTEGHAVEITHVAGEPAKASTVLSYSGVGVESNVLGFVQDMAPLYGSADLAICRSGASVCAELAVFGVPGILVPYPLASDDHQRANAEHYAEGGGVKIIEQADFDVGAVKVLIESMMQSDQDHDRMRNGMLACARIDAAKDLADIIENLGGTADADL